MEYVTQYSIGAIVGAIVGFLIGYLWKIKSGGYLPIVGKDETNRDFGIIMYPENGSTDLIFRDILYGSATVLPNVKIELRGPVTRTSIPVEVKPTDVIPSFVGTTMTSVLAAPGLAAGSVYIARLTVDGLLPNNKAATSSYDYIILT